MAHDRKKHGRGSEKRAFKTIKSSYTFIAKKRETSPQHKLNPWSSGSAGCLVQLLCYDVEVPRSIPGTVNRLSHNTRKSRVHETYLSR